MKSIYKSSLQLFSSQMLATVFSFLSSILLVRIMGPDGNGQWALFNTALSFAVTILGFSISTTIIYFINNQKYSPDKVLGFLFQYGLLTSLFLFFVIYAIRHLWGLDFIYPKNLQNHVFILIFCLMYFNSFCSTAYSTIFYALDKFKIQSLILLITPIANLLFYAIIYFGQINFFQEKLLLPLYANLAISILIQLLIYGIFYFLFDKKLSLKRLSLFQIKAIFSASILTYIATVFQFLSYRMDFWFINYYFDKSQLGIYALGTQVAQLMWLLPGAISQVTYSHLSSQEDELVTVRNLEKTIRICLFTLLLVCVFFFLGIYFLLPLIYGAAFKDAVWVVGLLIFGILPYSIPVLMASYFLSKGNFIVNTYAGILGFIVSLLLYSLLIPTFGIYGAAVGSIFSYLTNSIFAVVYMKKTSKFFSIKRIFMLQRSDFELFSNLLKSK